MNIQITYRGCEDTAPLEHYIHQELKKVQEFVDKEHGPANLEFVIEMHKVHQHVKVTARIRMPACNCIAEHQGTDVFAEIHEVCKRLYTQIINCKERRVDRNKHGCDGECRNARYEAEEKEEFGEEE